jgi:hypothetical protein
MIFDSRRCPDYAQTERRKKEREIVKKKKMRNY